MQNTTGNRNSQSQCHTQQHIPLSKFQTNTGISNNSSHFAYGAFEDRIVDLSQAENRNFKDTIESSIRIKLQDSEALNNGQSFANDYNHRSNEKRSDTDQTPLSNTIVDKLVKMKGNLPNQLDVYGQKTNFDEKAQSLPISRVGVNSS